MLRLLVESHHRPRPIRRTLPPVCFSLLVHGAVLSGVSGFRDDAVPSPVATPDDGRMIWIPPADANAPRPTALPSITRARVVLPSVSPEVPPPQLDVPRFPHPEATRGSAFGSATAASLFDQIGRGHDATLPFRVEELDVRPECIAVPDIPYPAAMRRAKMEGTVVLEAVIDVRGRVRSETLTTVFATHTAFIAVAKKMFERCVFRPGRAGGRPVQVLVRFPVKFELAPR